MTTNSTSPSASDPFVSKLTEGRQRFLAHVVEHAMDSGRRSPEDFIRHFPPTAIMKGLEQRADLRANILVLTTGVKQKIAMKKSWEDSATDLQIALDEHETDADSIVALFQPDDRVRYLDAEKLWSFLTEGEFWKITSGNKGAVETSRGHLAFMLERALEDKLVTHRDIIEGVTVEELATRLPKGELGRLIQCALQNADKGSPFTEADLLSTTPPRILTQYVPLTHLWDNVMVPKVAQRHGYAPSPRASMKPVEKADEDVTQSRPIASTRAKESLPRPKEAPSSKDAPRERETPTIPPGGQIPEQSGPVHKLAEFEDYSALEIVEDDIKAV